jgi:Icc protein
MMQFAVDQSPLCYSVEMHILHLTDCHLYGNAAGNLRGVTTDSSLRSVLDDARARCLAAPEHRYSAVLVTGDLVQDDPSGYERFRRMLGGLEMPVLCVPGNHDDPEPMHQALSAAPFQYCGAKSIGGWQFIMLNSYDAGHVGGRLTEAELARLDAVLAASPAHAMVCMHHHPVDMGSRWLEGIGLANAAAFWRIIDAHRHVRAVVWGHVHQVYDGERNGVRLIATPSTGAQFLPHSDRYAVDSAPPAYRDFELRPDGRLVSQVHWVAAAQQRVAAAR